MRDIDAEGVPPVKTMNEKNDLIQHMKDELHHVHDDIEHIQKDLEALIGHMKTPGDHLHHMMDETGTGAINPSPF